MENWFVVQTKPRQEVVAEEHLRRQSFRIYLPRISLPKRRRGKWLDVVEPLFPRYLFVRLDPEKISMAPIRSTRGVTGLVRFGSTPEPVRDDIIDYLLQQEDPDTGVHCPRARQFQKGEKIVVLSGPFAGIEGLFQTNSGKERALILIEMLGSQNKLLVERHILDHAS